VNLEACLYDVPTGGVPLSPAFCTGGNAVDVSDGLFSVMLGSINDTLCSAIEGRDELYLGITVGTDSEMEPRVQLGSVPFSMQALTVPDGSITTEKLAENAVTTENIQDGAVTSAKLGLTDGLAVLGTTTLDYNQGNVSGQALVVRSGAEQLQVVDVGDGDYLMIGNEGNSGYLYDYDADVGRGASIYLQHDGTVTVKDALKIDGPDPDGKEWIFFNNNDSIEFRDVELQPGIFYFNVDGGTGNARIRVAEVIQGATIEGNLLTSQELESAYVPRFSKGDLLCWDAENGLLERCATEASLFVVAVANESGMPVVLGAEYVKVLGPIQPGDSLVASD